MIGELYYSSYTKYELSSKLEEKFDGLCKVLSKEELGELNDLFGKLIRKNNDVIKAEINKKEKMIYKLMKRENIGGHPVPIYSFLSLKGLQPKIIDNKSFSQIIKKISSNKRAELNEKYKFFQKESKEPLFRLPSSVRGALLNNIEQMKNRNLLGKSKNSKYILENYSKIKSAIEKEDRLSRIVQKIEDIISELQKDDKVDFTEMKEHLKKMKESYSKELYKITKYLNGIDFSEITNYVKSSLDDFEQAKVDSVIEAGKSKSQANEICRDYIRYKATLKDKTNCLSFREYAKQMFNIDDISFDQVDENLKDKAIGFF